jgi:hypothetical protein
MFTEPKAVMEEPLADFEETVGWAVAFKENSPSPLDRRIAFM